MSSSPFIFLVVEWLNVMLNALVEVGFFFYKVGVT